jgi:hypothetical protein
MELCSIAKKKYYTKCPTGIAKNKYNTKCPRGSILNLERFQGVIELTIKWSKLQYSYHYIVGV